jgi:hypothetical protein
MNEIGWKIGLLITFQLGLDLYLYLFFYFYVLYLLFFLLSLEI